MSDLKLSDLEVSAYIVARWHFLQAHYSPEVKIARYGQMEGPDKWAVQAGSDVLNKSGQWEWEPKPSSRDDAYMARCRYDSAQEALDAYNKLPKAGEP